MVRDRCAPNVWNGTICKAMSKMLKAAIIGCGRIGCRMDDDAGRDRPWTHAGAYKKAEGVRVVAAVDPDPKRIEDYRERWGDVDTYTDLAALLTENPPDVVSICTQPHLHAQQVIQCAAAGVKGIFCEKPMCLSIEEADQMIEACAHHGAKLAVNHNRRWDACYQVAWERIRAGEIGDVISISGICSPGVVNTGSHLLDLMRMFGGEVDWVAMDGQVLESGDLAAWGAMKYKSGVDGFFHSRGMREYIHFEMDVVGSAGRLRIMQNGAVLRLSRAGYSGQYSDYQDLIAQGGEHVHGLNRMVRAIENICKAVEDSQPLACTGEDGRACVELISAIRMSAAKEGKRIFMPVSNTKFRILNEDT